MNRQICLTALSLTVVLGGVTATLAAGHKHSATDARAQGQTTRITDPRAAYKPQGSNHQTWCDISSQCNGWDLWMEDVNEGKLKAGGG
jgi:hypothetical protein